MAAALEKITLDEVRAVAQRYFQGKPSVHRHRAPGIPTFLKLTHG